MPCSVVERRQKKAHNDYIRKAKEIDIKNGFPGPGPGPVETYLQSFGRVRGLVIGTRGEASSDLHALVEKVCMKKAEELVQETGYTLQAAKAVVKRGVCRRLGSAFVKYNMLCKRLRLSILIGGSRSAKARLRLQARTRSHEEEYYFLFGCGARPFRGLRV